MAGVRARSGRRHGACRRALVGRAEDWVLVVRKQGADLKSRQSGRLAGLRAQRMDWHDPTVVCGGSSSAGAVLGVSDDRDGWPAKLRSAGALRVCPPGASAASKEPTSWPLGRDETLIAPWPTTGCEMRAAAREREQALVGRACPARHSTPRSSDEASVRHAPGRDEAEAAA